MISVIIPVLNEAARIEACLEALLPWHDSLELIVVDGGSQDLTVQLAQKFPVKVIHGSPVRGRQMNQGTAIAIGDMYLFLHCDTRLPDEFIETIQQILAQPNTIAGAFSLCIDDPDPNLRWIERFVQWRSHFLSLPYGDQAIFMRATDFHALGGFAELPIMEDYELIQRLKRRRSGRIVVASQVVCTSARRWQKLGVWRTTWLNQLMIAGYHLGIDPHTLRNWYRQQ